jgi:hypothetical protein
MPVGPKSLYSISALFCVSIFKISYLSENIIKNIFFLNIDKYKIKKIKKIERLLKNGKESMLNKKSESLQAILDNL